tara:strand:- start:242 stop:496 length:255 start_codon:yes stop_codon:yes gene_type:complete
MFKNIKVEEILVYLMLIVVGYYIAKMFSRSCNGFSVGGKMSCEKTFNTLKMIVPGNECKNNKAYNPRMNNTPVDPDQFDNICCQ